MDLSTSITGKVALVAGGGQGIGRSTSLAFAQSGGVVAVLDADRDHAHAVVAEVKALGGEALPVVADLRDEQACAAAVAFVHEELGGLDVLANVAGGLAKHASRAPVSGWSTESWDAIVHLNLRYVFWLCRAALPIMAARGGGAIVNVGSIAGSFGNANHGPYGAAKAALGNLTKTLAIETGPMGIRVNIVSPGITLADDTAGRINDDVRASLARIAPLARTGHPDDIARAVLFFASPLSGFVTGQELLVDGGVSVNFPYPAIGS